MSPFEAIARADRHGASTLPDTSQLNRMGTPADIGNAVAMLCSEKADFITGQTIHVDGGASVMDPVFPLPVQGIS